MTSEASRKHKERRKKLEEARQERRRLEMEAELKRKQKKTSSKALFRWVSRLPRPEVPLRDKKTGAGVIIRHPFFYIGKNMNGTPAPNIPEPSGIDPTLNFADSSEYAEPLGKYPMYALLSEEQRYGYLSFLASERDEAEDIGYVFLYLCGFERRLIIDSPKPGEVTPEEKESITKELIRLYNCFASESASLAQYIVMLLLYDGTMFDIMSEEEIREFLELDVEGSKTKYRNRIYSENADGMSYLLLGRMLEHGMKPDIRDIATAAKGRLVRSSAAAMSGISLEELYDERLDALLIERLQFVDLSRIPKTSARNISTPVRPCYFPSSASIRRHNEGGLPITSNIVPDPEEQLPLKAIADMILTCKNDLEYCESVLSTSSLRDIDKVQLDALEICSGNNTPLQEFLSGKNGATYVPIDVLSQELKSRFNTSISYTSKGILSSQTQQLIAVAAFINGWQSMLPDVIEGTVSSFWRIDEKSHIVLFKRGTAHNKSNGKKCLGPVFGKDGTSYSIVIPGNWSEPSVLAYIYAWFLSKLPNRFDKTQLTMFLSKYHPPFTNQNGNKKNQIAFFFSLLHTTYSLKLSTHGVKQCLGMASFPAVQELLFTLCDNAFGNLIPEDVMEVFEEVYKKSGEDPSRILYDYHAGTYQKPQSSNMGFVIDEEKFAETLADTTSVQDMLAGAMEQDNVSTDDVSAPEAQSSNIGDVTDASEIEEENTEHANETGNIRKLVEEFFEDTDEKPTNELLDFIISNGLAATNAEAMGVIADLNSAAGEELVEIDGTDAYWNA